MEIRNLARKKAFGNFLKAIRYTIVGGVCAIIDYSAYYLAFRILQIHYLLSLLASFVITGGSGYLLHKYFTFADKSRNYFTQISTFVLVITLSLLVNFILMYTFVGVFNIYALTAKVMCIFLMWPVNFAFQNYITFRNQS